MPESARFLPLSPSSLGRRLGRLLLEASLGCVLTCLGCAAETSPGPETGGSPPVLGAESIEFRPSETLLLGPGDRGELTLQVEPAGFHSVSFSLAASPSDTGFDGFLEAANVVTDASGLAQNVIQAPSSAAVFEVRASVGDTLVAVRTVSVSTEGFATLIATPAYDGVRDVDSWDAVATLGVSCADLEALWDEGDLEAHGSSRRATLSDVPVGPDLALVVRAGRYIGGCVTISGLAAGEERAVEVPVTDRPLQLTDSSFDLTLDIEERTEPFVQLLQQAATQGASDYAQAYEEDADVLLADCASAIEESEQREYFLAHTAAFGYLEVTRSHLSSPTVVRDVVLSRLIQAAASIDGPGVFELTAELDGTNSTLTLARAGGVPRALSGFSDVPSLSVVREPDDHLILSADLEFQATRWLGAIAFSGADADIDVPAALVAAADCAGLVTAWAQAGGVEIYPDCDDDCALAVCQAGLELGWERARTTAEGQTILRVGISADAEIDDEAHPIALTGEWVGSIDSSELSVAGSAVSPADD